MRDRALIFASVCVAVGGLGMGVWGVVASKKPTEPAAQPVSEVAPVENTSSPALTAAAYRDREPAPEPEPQVNEPTREEKAEALRMTKDRHMVRAWLSAEREGRRLLATRYRKALLQNACREALEAEFDETANDADRGLLAALIEEKTR